MPSRFDVNCILLKFAILSTRHKWSTGNYVAPLINETGNYSRCNVNMNRLTDSKPRSPGIINKKKKSLPNFELYRGHNYFISKFVLKCSRLSWCTNLAFTTDNFTIIYIILLFRQIFQRYLNTTGTLWALHILKKSILTILAKGNKLFTH